jgi:DNA-directed RNA polymerase omega subunit
MKMLRKKPVLAKIPNDYIAVIVAARKAKELNMIPAEERAQRTDKVTTLALEAIAEGRTTFKLQDPIESPKAPKFDFDEPDLNPKPKPEPEEEPEE